MAPGNCFLNRMTGRVPCRSGYGRLDCENTPRGFYWRRRKFDGTIGYGEDDEHASEAPAPDRAATSSGRAKTIGRGPNAANIQTADFLIFLECRVGLAARKAGLFGHYAAISPWGPRICSMINQTGNRFLCNFFEHCFVRYLAGIS